MQEISQSAVINATTKSTNELIEQMGNKSFEVGSVDELMNLYGTQGIDQINKYSWEQAATDALAGGAAGAAAGTGIMPGWGTLIGAVAGSALGNAKSIIGNHRVNNARSAINVANERIDRNLMAAGNNLTQSSLRKQLANYSDLGGPLTKPSYQINTQAVVQNPQRITQRPTNEISAGSNTKTATGSNTKTANWGAIASAGEPIVDFLNFANGVDIKTLMNKMDKGGFLDSAIKMRQQAELNNAVETLAYVNYVTGGALFPEIRKSGDHIYIRPEDEVKFTKAARANNMSSTEFLREVYSPRSSNSFAAGGFVNENDSESLNYFGAGGSHEQHPEGGVLQGIGQNGLPNRVEQREYKDKNNFVFGDRLKASAETLRQFNLPEKYANNTFADIVTQLKKESDDRPHDPISKSGLDSSLAKLRAAQEYTKMTYNNMLYNEDEAFQQYNTTAYGGNLFDGTKGSSQITTGVNYAKMGEDEAIERLRELYLDKKYKEAQLFVDNYFGAHPEKYGFKGPDDHLKNSQGNLGAREAGNRTSQYNIDTFLRRASVDLNKLAKLGIRLSSGLKYGLDMGGLGIIAAGEALADGVTRLFTPERTLLEAKKASQEAKNENVETKNDKEDIMRPKPPATFDSKTFDSTIKKEFDDWVVENKIPKNVAAVIYGTIMQESSFRPEAIGDKGASLGLLQWNGARREALNKYLKEVENDPKSLGRKQLDFLWKELHEGENGWSKGTSYDGLVQSEDPYSYFTDKFVRPSTDEKYKRSDLRLRYASEYVYPTFQAGAPHKIPETSFTVPEDNFDSSALESFLDPNLSPDDFSSDLDPEYETQRLKQLQRDQIKSKVTSGMRYAPVLGNAIALGVNLFDQPDREGANLIANNTKMISSSPVQNRLTYNPFDTEYYQNQLYNMHTSTKDALAESSGGNRAAYNAGLLALNNNTQQQVGAMARQAAEYNNANRQQVEAFNSQMNMFNSQQSLKAQQINAQNLLNSAALRAQHITTANNAREAAISSAFNGIFSDLGNIGLEEERQKNARKFPLSRYMKDKDGNYILKED